MKGKWNKNIKSLKRNKIGVSSICDKKIQEFEEQDYLSLKGSKSVSDPKNEEKIEVPICKTNQRKYSTTSVFKRN